MTRFWITLNEGVDFVLSSLEMMRGGEDLRAQDPVNVHAVARLAEAMAPGVPTKIVGIRPGEKLHEMMISSDDARSTVDLGDRYAIEPEFVEYPRKAFRDEGHKGAQDGFVYSSDINEDWLDEAGLKRMLEA